MRTFVAFTLPDDVAAQIAQWAEANKPEGVFLEPVTNLHMTLAFLGDTPDELVEPINNILAGLDPASVQINGPIRYEEQARLAFLTYEEVGGSAVWEQLNAQLKQLTGYEPQFSPWLPHTTVWRFAPDHKPNVNPPLPQLSFTPTAVTLYQSVRNEGGGATYQKVGANWDEVVREKAGKGEFLPGAQAIVTFSNQEGLNRGDMVTLIEVVKRGMEGDTWRVRDKDGNEFPYPRMRMFVPPSLEPTGELWPDTIPWGDEEQEYYRQGNIFDPVEPTLDQHVFNGIDVRHTVQKFMTTLYFRALQHQLGVVGFEWADLYFTGSLTTYQYSETSDADVSVFPNYDKIWKSLGLDPRDARRELIDMSITHLDGTFLPGTSHPVQFFVCPPGIYPPDLYKPGLRSAYDLQDKDWFVKPERSRSHVVQEDMPQEFQRAADIAEKMTIMLDDHNYDAAKELWHTVHAKRQLDQRAGLGDYCEGNIVYKWMLHEGLFDRIRNELHEYIAKTAVEWDGGELDPRRLDAEREDGGMGVWTKLQGQVEQLAQQYNATITWLPRNRVMHAECATNYDATEGWDKGQIKLTFDIKAAELTGEVSYYITLHEIGHAAFRTEHFVDVISMENSQEEEAWCTHFALENSQINFDMNTLMMMHENMKTYEDLPVLSPSSPGWFTSSVDHLWDERVTTKVIYDWDEDRIVLGTQATLPDLNNSAKIVGEYVDGKVSLFEADKQWINPTYFRRLWHASYPDRELKDVFFRRETGEEYKLRSLPRKRKNSSSREDQYRWVLIDGKFVMSNDVYVSHSDLILDALGINLDDDYEPIKWSEHDVSAGYWDAGTGDVEVKHGLATPAQIKRHIRQANVTTV